MPGTNAQIHFQLAPAVGRKPGVLQRPAHRVEAQLIASTRRVDAVARHRGGQRVVRDAPGDFDRQRTVIRDARHARDPATTLEQAAPELFDFKSQRARDAHARHHDAPRLSGEGRH